MLKSKKKVKICFQFMFSISQAEIYFLRLQYVIMSVQSVVMSTMVLGEEMEFHQKYLKVLMKKITIEVFDSKKAENVNNQQFVVHINSTSPNSVIDIKVLFTQKKVLNTVLICLPNQTSNFEFN